MAKKTHREKREQTNKNNEERKEDREKRVHVAQMGSIGRWWRACQSEARWAPAKDTSANQNADDGALPSTNAARVRDRHRKGFLPCQTSPELMLETLRFLL